MTLLETRHLLYFTQSVKLRCLLQVKKLLFSQKKSHLPTSIPFHFILASSLLTSPPPPSCSHRLSGLSKLNFFSNLACRQCSPTLSPSTILLCLQTSSPCFINLHELYISSLLMGYHIPFKKAIYLCSLHSLQII